MTTTRNPCEVLDQMMALIPEDDTSGLREQLQACHQSFAFCPPENYHLHATTVIGILRHHLGPNPFILTGWKFELFKIWKGPVK